MLHVDSVLALFHEVVKAHERYLESDVETGDTLEFAQRVEDIVEYYRAHA